VNKSQTIQRFGYSLEELPNVKSIPKTTYYNKEGVPLCNLPSDSYHMKKYLARGFTLEPPKVNKS
jgi:hypothetical protein